MKIFVFRAKGHTKNRSLLCSRSCTGRIHRCVCLRQPVSAAQTGILCFQRAQSAHLLGANVGEKSCHRHQLRLGRPGHPADAVHLAAKRGARHLFPAGRVGTEIPRCCPDHRAFRSGDWQPLQQPPRHGYPFAGGDFTGDSSVLSKYPMLPADRRLSSFVHLPVLTTIWSSTASIAAAASPSSGIWIRWTGRVCPRRRSSSGCADSLLPAPFCCCTQVLNTLLRRSL